MVVDVECVQYLADDDLIPYVDADDYVPSFDDMYPYALDFPVLDGPVDYTWKPTNVTYPSSGELASTDPGVVGGKILALKAIAYSFSERPPYIYEMLPGDFEPCYYVLRNFSSPQGSMLYRITQKDVNYLLGLGMIPPYGDIDIDFDAEGGGFLIFLHDLGEQLILNNPLFDIFSIEVNGVSFLALLFGSGFFLFCTWTVFKWLNPL